tara:strand:- start:118 stop:318 length:201 start_codon:yes stop_codon:yes gene_type:complete
MHLSKESREKKKPYRRRDAASHAADRRAFPRLNSRDPACGRASILARRMRMMRTGGRGRVRASCVF